MSFIATEYLNECFRHLEAWKLLFPVLSSFSTYFHTLNIDETILMIKISLCIWIWEKTPFQLVFTDHLKCLDTK